jgi:Tol biopolymer transport system component
MALATGQSLLQFRLVDRIGEGGMGEVWRARDTTLDREVAIKVLPAAFERDPDRLARFEREAKVLASLNHPNIAAIYGFHELEGVRFLAMEMVEGDDLAAVLKRGPLPIREALDAARQIAAALEAAHDRGVVHRDLKPANVKRTPQGQVKVLDFGLAKALEPAGSVSGQTATVTSAGSEAGMILGTASYMSPEQARGLAVDRRTDLWAFGCVLFEMLSGVKAFDGPTVTDVLAAIVTGEPDWEKLPASCPVPVRRLLRRCLEKDARRRLRDAGDASLLLDDNPEDARTGPVRPVPPERRPRLPILAAIAAAAVVLAAMGGYLAARRGATPTTEAELTFQRVTFARGMMRSARFTSDGRTIVYGAAWGGPPIRLYLARTDSPESTPIPLPPAELLAVSRSGELAVALGLAYSGWMGDGTLARTALLGGTPREIVEHVRAADWSPDGSELAIVRRVEGLEQLEYPIGKVLYKTSGYIADIRISPDGARVAFTDHPVWADDRGDLAVVDRDGKKTTLAADFASIRGVAWAPDGREVWYTGVPGDEGLVLGACTLDGGKRVVWTSLTPIELFDIAPDGRVLMASHRNERGVDALLSGWSQPRALIVPAEASLSRSISDDGRVAAVASHATKEYEGFAVRADRAGALRLSAGDVLQLSPDGTKAIVASADARVLSVSPVGMGATRAIPNPDGLRYEGLPAWLRDGRRIVTVARRGDEPTGAFVIDTTTGASRRFGTPGIQSEYFGCPPVSTDGRFVVLQDANGMPMRWPVEGGEPLAIPGGRAGDQPLAFTEDGTGLFVSAPGVPVEIERLDLRTGSRVRWNTVAPSDAAGVRIVAPTITPNGKYWALSTSKLLTDLYVVGGLR